MESPIRIVVADDNEIVRKSLGLFIESNPDLDLVGEAADGYEAISICTAKQPDLIMMDINMPYLSGIDATKIIRRRYPNICILAVTSFSDNGKIKNILDAGANDFIIKDFTGDELITTINSIIEGEVFGNPKKGL
jgi:DNA-binding NarL/FixJ family response regulator